ncbi:MFS transporter [Saccharopolyspora karakumensis]|uniref:Putative proline/betaine transporter n=1 Tax=Saccharopolyspora karakumensis TaxID=2530386 RepID=A0A4R5BPF5_9PSEU|nr:MFS transporter [Saccharopolyspora karakumensis]TDD87070.1 MFS transporter [Saccharopolyspora karakumensis]
MPQSGEHQGAAAVDKTPDSLRKVTTAAVVGTVVEWFDFVLFGAMAALVFGRLFFPSQDPAAGTLAALATYGSGFLVRPLGSIVFGHIGDRYGRKKALTLSLLLMGVATFSIGLLPTYQSAGVLATVLLVVARLVQGFAVGGEYGGAVLLVVERSDVADRRGFYGAWLSSASPLAYILVTATMASVSALVPPAEFDTWGWRIPFLVTAVMVLIGLYIRASLSESELFKEAQGKSAERTETLPILELLKSSRSAILSAVGMSLFSHSGYYVVAVYGLAYAKAESGLDETLLLVLMMIAAVVYFASIMIGGYLSDRVGRKAPMSVGTVGFGLWIFAVYPLVDQGTALSVGAAFSVCYVFLGLVYGPLSVWLAELFDTKVRYTGVSFGYTVAAIVGGGVVPSLAASLVERTGSTVGVSALILVAAVLALITMAFTKRSKA